MLPDVNKLKLINTKTVIQNYSKGIYLKVFQDVKSTTVRIKIYTCYLLHKNVCYRLWIHMHFIVLMLMPFRCSHSL